MNIIKVIIFLLALLLMSAGITYYAFNYKPSPEEEEAAASLKFREELNNQRSQILRNMSPEAKKYMETERKMQVKAYHKAYESLTPEEVAKYKEIRAKIKENTDAEREFYNGLSPEDRKALKSPPGQGNLYYFTVQQSVRDKMTVFANQRMALENQIPEKIKNIELDPADKAMLDKMRVEALDTMGVGGNPTGAGDDR